MRWFCGLLSSIHDRISDSIIVLLIGSTGVLPFPTCKLFVNWNIRAVVCLRIQVQKYKWIPMATTLACVTWLGFCRGQVLGWLISNQKRQLEFADVVNYEQPLSPRYHKDIPKISPRYLVTSIALILFKRLREIFKKLNKYFLWHLTRRGGAQWARRPTN